MSNKIHSLAGGNIARIVAVGLFAFLGVWWAVLYFRFQSQLLSQNLIWAASYQSLAIFGAIVGLYISKKWGGFNSVIGRAILFFALGLIAQVFGQTIFSYYNLILKVEIPYPSLADVGYFGSIPLYIYGVILLGRSSGVKVSLKSFGNKIQAVLIPAVILCASYWAFLSGYEFDWTDPLRIFLDFGYPLGQAVYVSLALLVFLLSHGVLGGMMKPKIFGILIALFIQYVADYNFLYQAMHQTWTNGGYGDFIYLGAYFAMTLGLISLGSVWNKIKES